MDSIKWIVVILYEKEMVLLKVWSEGESVSFITGTKFMGHDVLQLCQPFILPVNKVTCLNIDTCSMTLDHMFMLKLPAYFIAAFIPLGT